VSDKVYMIASQLKEDIENLYENNKSIDIGTNKYQFQIDYKNLIR